MGRIRAGAAILQVCLLTGGLSSCLVKRRLITRTGAKTAQPVLLTARVPDLEQRITQQFSAIRDFSATVDMTPALGTAEKNKITEYKDVRGYILFRKPAEIRILGLYPVVRNTAFDMVSDGAMFRLYIPSQNRFVVGNNTVEQPSRVKIENLRPQHFVDALLVRPVGPDEKVILENFTDEDNAFLILHVVHEAGAGELVLQRTIWFNRVDLRLARQILLDGQGNILTDARYSDWTMFDNVPFPKHVEINRPQDEYAVVLNVVKMDINKGVTDDKFVLQQPEGTKLQTIGQTAPAVAPASKGPVAQ
jgi:outer membrane lipoprotein-sorting protein